MRYSDKLTLIELLAKNTTRQIFKEYREAIKHLSYVTEHRNAGSEWHLGEPMHIVYNDAKVYLNLVIAELNNRGTDMVRVKNIPELIEAKMLKQLEAEKNEKNKVIAEKREADQIKMDAAKLAPCLDAVAKFAMYQLNYENDFIEKAFGVNNIAKHLQLKFNHAYDKYKPQGAFIMFWAELDIENRNILAKYILTK